MSDPKTQWGLHIGGMVCCLVGLACGIAAFAIAQETLDYAAEHKAEFRRIDSTGIPCGPLMFLFVCVLPLMLAGVVGMGGITFCTLGIVGTFFGWRGASQRDSSVREARTKKKRQVREDPFAGPARRQKRRRPEATRYYFDRAPGS